jgi:hypothetical protein
MRGQARARKKKGRERSRPLPFLLPVVAVSERKQDIHDLLAVARLLHVGQLAATAV